ncbi:MAG: HDOD domain-containing protein [Deltaproteobacteria bacterium]|nr:MAG: HDOD domain-containing protein [Deltaproteobacteria bacterium]
MANASATQPDLDLSGQLVERLRTTEVRVPPYPAVASSLDRLNRDGKATVAEVASIVATDAALAATVLRHATSAAMRSNAPLTLEAAIYRLGLDELTRVVIAATIGVSAGAPGPLAALRRDQWRRSLLGAMFCRELAARRGVPPDQAFLAGLLHDFGAIVVVACIESMGTAALPVLPEATWRRTVEDLHVEFGMVVVARWQLPEPIAEVVASHHTPHTCMRVHRPLVQLVAVVDDIIAILDDSSRGGLAGLVDVPGLEHDERFRIGALMPKVAEQMARFETPAERDVASKIAPGTQTLEGGWPVDFPIVSRNQVEHRACALASSTLAFHSRTPLQQGWLAELTLRCAPDTITMLANVKSCQPMPGGGHLVIAQPFGLAGDDRAAWLRLVERTRRANGEP